MKSTTQVRQSRHLYIRQKDLLALLPFSAATLWRKVKGGTFVRPVKLSERVTAWSLDQVDEWIRKQGDQK